jgi:hypothetical protein
MKVRAPGPESETDIVLVDVDGTIPSLNSAVALAPDLIAG